MENAKKTTEMTTENSFYLNNLKTVINDFCTNTTTLQGAGWNEFRRIIDSFQDSIENIKLFSTELSETILQAEKELNECLDGYNGNIPIPSFVNPGDEKSATEDKINECKKTINYLETQDKKANIKIIASLNKKNQELNNLQAYLALMEKLLKIKNDYYGKFESLKASIDNLKKTFL